MINKAIWVAAAFASFQMSAQEGSPAEVKVPLAQLSFSQAAGQLQSPAVIPPPLVMPSQQVSSRPWIPNPAIVSKHTELPVSPSGQEALVIAKQWQNGDSLPIAGKDGVILFRFGSAMPPIVCAPERQTLIRLQPGEHLTHEPILGDSYRWQAVILTTGQGGGERTVIAIKFVKPGFFQTDLVLPTNRRIYQLNLQTNLTQHLSQVEFTYPDDPEENWRRYQAEQNERRLEKESQRKQANVAFLAGPPNHNYTVRVARKHRPPFIPKTVFDDGNQTFFKMPVEAQHWDAAILQIAGPSGCEIVNYRLAEHDPTTWIIDRLFTRAELISGTGKHAERVSIERDGATETVRCGKSLPDRVEVESAKRK